MQRFFNNQKTLIGAVGLVMLGIGNAEAIGLFNNGQAGIRSAISNVQANMEASDFVAQTGRVEDASKVHNGVSAYTSALPTTAFGQFAVTDEGLDVWDGLADGNLSIEDPLYARAFRYSDMLNMAVYDGTATMLTNSLGTLIPFPQDGGAAMMPSAKAATNEYREASPVPLPAAAWSFLIGLMGILGLKKRKSPPDETR